MLPRQQPEWRRPFINGVSFIFDDGPPGNIVKVPYHEGHAHLSGVRIYAFEHGEVNLKTQGPESLIRAHDRWFAKQADLHFIQKMAQDSPGLLLIAGIDGD